jgi:hypothetical protein
MQREWLNPKGICRAAWRKISNLMQMDIAQHEAEQNKTRKTKSVQPEKFHPDTGNGKYFSLKKYDEGGNRISRRHKASYPLI